MGRSLSAWPWAVRRKTGFCWKPSKRAAHSPGPHRGQPRATLPDATSASSTAGGKGVNHRPRRLPANPVVMAPMAMVMMVPPGVSRGRDSTGKRQRRQRDDENLHWVVLLTAGHDCHNRDRGLRFPLRGRLVVMLTPEGPLGIGLDPLRPWEADVARRANGCFATERYRPSQCCRWPSGPSRLSPP